MNYFAILLLLIGSMYPLSYAGYNWRKNNKLAAVGCFLLVVLSIGLPIYAMITRSH